MTTYVTRHFCYALRGHRQRLTVAFSRSSLGHCEGASKAVSAVRAAASFSPLAFLSVRTRSSHPKSHSETAGLVSTERTSFSGFTGGLNKVMHALNGNIFYQAAKPKPHCTLWRDSFYLPNGMTVFRYAFYGKESLWLHATRRGSYFELETTRADSKTLYGLVLRAVASKKGEPGNRWPLVQVYKSQVSLAQVGAVSRSQRYPQTSVSGTQNPIEAFFINFARFRPPLFFQLRFRRLR